MIVDFNGTEYGIGIFDFSGGGSNAVAEAIRGCAHSDDQAITNATSSDEAAYDITITDEAC